MTAVTDDPLAFALVLPANPMAAMAENTAESISDTATVRRVILETDRMPLSRIWPTRGRFLDPKSLERALFMSTILMTGVLSSLGNIFEMG